MSDAMPERVSLPEHWGRFQATLVPPKEISALRRALYHSEGPGYVVLPGFLESPYLEHVQRYWLETPPSESEYTRWIKQERYAPGQPPMRTSNERRTVHAHFLWNTPPDEVSAALAHAVQGVRNLVEGAVPYRGLVADGERVLTWRVVASRRSEGDEVKPHEDHFPGEAGELTRLQATLFLSEPGEDWSGEGFCLETNRGEERSFGVDVPVHAGDLVLWRYRNRHRVGTIETPAGGRGFLRMIFPMEKSVKPPKPSQFEKTQGDGAGKDKKKDTKPADPLLRLKKLAWRANAARRRLLGGGS